MTYTLQQKKLGGTVTVPPSKSLAHRSFLAAALASGESHITNVIFSQDMDATLGAVTQMGATVQRGADWVTITGNGGQFPKIEDTVDCGESGSTLRFLLPLLTHSGHPVTFGGRGRLMARSQSVYQQLFQEKGLEFLQTADRITTKGQFSAGRYTVDGSVSSQFITGLLYTLPLLEGDSEISVTEPFESRSYVNLTVQTLEDFGVTVSWKDQNTLLISGGQQFTATDYRVEGDCSQAAFFAVLGALTGGITLTDLRWDTLQGDRVVFDVLKEAGAQWETLPTGAVFSKSKLKGVTIDLADCPDLGPIFMVLGLFASGETVITNAGRLRDKESDRIATMVEEITKLGGDISVAGDCITVKKSVLRGGVTLSSHNDHRVAMALSVACLATGVEATLEQAEAVEKSFPHFFQVLEGLYL